jgi:hypothetical protein
MRQADMAFAPLNVRCRATPTGPATSLVAETVIELAMAGVHDAQTLRTMTLKQFSNGANLIAMSADLDALNTVSQYARLTKSRKVSVKNCAQIVAGMVREQGHAFAIDGHALLFDALLPFVSLTHRG